MAGQLKSIQKRLNASVDSQKYHRRREARGRSSAESLNERVQYWSAGQTVVLVVVAVVQVAMVRRLFAHSAQLRHGCRAGRLSPDTLPACGYAHVEISPLFNLGSRLGGHMQDSPTL